MYVIKAWHMFIIMAGHMYYGRAYVLWLGICMGERIIIGEQ